MAIKRYVANADNTITNAFDPDLQTRATGANMGYSDIVETFSIYGRQATSSVELQRILMKFPVNSIVTDRNNGDIPASGSVNFVLRLYNAPHSKTVPEDYALTVEPISTDWQEGTGLDMETYKDLTKGNKGSNWMSASKTAPWTKTGGDYISTANAAYPYRWYTQSFATGLEDMEVDITGLVELWAAETISNYGVGIHLTGTYEGYYDRSEDGTYEGWNQNTTGSTISYYTKRFFGRGTQYFFLKPTIEARWDSARRDQRGDFYYSSSIAPLNDNVNTLFLYNYIRGALSDIPGHGSGDAIYVSLYSGSADNSEPSGSAIELPTVLPRTTVSEINPYVVTASWVSTGIYQATFACTSAAAPLTKLFDVWHDGSGYNKPHASVEYATSSFVPTHFSASQTITKPVHYLNITNLRDLYRSDETARFNLFVRNKYWEPTIYTVANTSVESTTIQSASYRVFRLMDAYEAVPYGTGSDLHTGLSYDISGNYFDFDMNLLQPGYAYGFKFSFYDPSLNTWSEQRQTFKFRVEDYEY
mgnify:CR=1 FL=1|tara:strand:+ start:23129 stop:24721 length:1593 start_codon:yes stop_codon:yes gene_type:complete